MTTNHHQFYDQTSLYAAAFAWRDVRAECDFLASVCQQHTSAPPDVVLEIACGPADHALHFARHAAQNSARDNVESHALDLSSSMLSYAAQRAQAHHVTLHTHLEDMTSFELDVQANLAMCLMDSLAYITSHHTLMTHLSSVATALADEGIYIIEASHPSDAFGTRTTTSSTWETAMDDDRRLTVMFGREDDPFDALSQVSQTTVTLELTGHQGTILSFTETCPMRTWLYPELEQCIAHHPDFDLVQTFGALDVNVPLTSEPPAWRMVLVLQRRPRAHERARIT